MAQTNPLGGEAEAAAPALRPVSHAVEDGRQPATAQGMLAKGNSKWNGHLSRRLLDSAGQPRLSEHRKAQEAARKGHGRPRDTLPMMP